MANTTCHHFETLAESLDPVSDVCDECVAQGDRWVHLRSCLQCGQVGCCDNSVNRHARKHYESAGHQLMRSIEPGETWRYCFEDHVLAY